MARPSPSQMLLTSAGEPSKVRRSFSKISTPSNPTAAAACSFSGKVPLRQTVAMALERGLKDVAISLGLPDVSLIEHALVISHRPLAHRTGIEVVRPGWIWAHRFCGVHDRLPSGRRSGRGRHGLRRDEYTTPADQRVNGLLEPGHATNVARPAQPSI